MSKTTQDVPKAKLQCIQENVPKPDINLQLALHDCRDTQGKYNEANIMKAVMHYI